MYLSETYSSAGREEVLLYYMAGHKHAESNQSFFGLIHMLPLKTFTSLRHWRLRSCQLQGRLSHCEPMEVSRSFH